MAGDDEQAINSFPGIARLFPLPDLVLFPQVEQGLHIFEPRYIRMTSDALADDHLIALVLLRSEANGQSHYEGRPAIETMACLGRIVAFEELTDGRFNLKLRGLRRLKLGDELAPEDCPYRRASGELLSDKIPSDLNALATLRQSLRETVLSRFDSSGAAYRQIDDLFDTDAPLGRVCDLLSYALPIPTELKQHLLSEPDVTLRAEMLSHALKSKPRQHRKFPPEFSNN